MINTIDIMIPNMNGGKYLKNTLDSILCQTYENFNVYLIDNASTDNSIEIFESYIEDRFFVVKYTDRVSLSENLNRCLENVKSPLFCIMHTDDIYSNKYLEVMSNNLLDNENALIAFCNSYVIDINGARLRSLKYLIKRVSFKLDKNIEIYKGESALIDLFFYNFIVAPSVMYKKIVIDINGFFNEDQMFVVDWDYYFRLLFIDKSILKINSPLFYYRLHTNQLTYSMTKDLNKYSEMHLFKKKIMERLIGMNYNNWFLFKLKIRYKFPLILSILYDSLIDLFSLRISMFTSKIFYLFKLVFCEK